MTTAATTIDPGVDEHIGSVRESETGGVRGRTLWSAVFFASGFLAVAATLPFVVVADGRSLFRPDDLLELVRLLHQIKGAVKEILP